MADRDILRIKKSTNMRPRYGSVGLYKFLFGWLIAGSVLCLHGILITEIKICTGQQWGEMYPSLGMIW